MSGPPALSTSLLLLGLLAALDADARPIAIRAGSLIDPAAGTASKDQLIVVGTDGKIAAVGPRSAVKIPDDAELIDLSALSVLPGLIDAHTHLCFTFVHRGGPGSLEEEAIQQTIVDTTAHRALIGAANARAMLHAGFTTVRDVGNAGNYADTALRRAIEEHLVEGPTIVNSGKIITPLGGFGSVNADHLHLNDDDYLQADTRDELLKAVRQNVQLGAKVIKIVVEAGGDNGTYYFSPEDIRFVVEQAAKSELKVAAHCMSPTGCQNAIRGGVASIEHGFFVSDADLALMAKNKMVLVPTNFPKPMMTMMGFGRVDAFYSRLTDRLARAKKAGVPIVFGSDAFGNLPNSDRGRTALSYLGALTDAGLSPAAILRSMTTDAAKLLGVDNDRGAIRAGLAADLVATASNPLEDPHALEGIAFVMKAGVVVSAPPAVHAVATGEPR
jgi:imidazolonepropionase-like amidohydrolase